MEQLSDAKSRLGEPRRNSSMGCFGGGKPMDGDEKCEFVKLEPASERLLPLGLVGLRNHGVHPGMQIYIDVDVGFPRN